MKKVTMAFDDFDKIIFETGSRLMVRKPKHLLQSLPDNIVQILNEKYGDSSLELSV